MSQWSVASVLVITLGVFTGAANAQETVTVEETGFIDLDQSGEVRELARDDRVDVADRALASAGGREESAPTAAPRPAEPES